MHNLKMCLRATDLLP